MFKYIRIKPFTTMLMIFVLLLMPWGTHPLAFDGARKAFVDPEILIVLEGEDYVPIIAFFVASSNPDVPNNQADAGGGSPVSVVNSLQERARASAAGAIGILTDEIERGNIKEYRSLWIVNAFSANVNISGLQCLAGIPQIKEIRLDRPLSLSPKVTAGFKEPSEAEKAAAPETGVPLWNLELINAPAAWQKGITGKDTVVAIMDTGVDPHHPALQEKYRGNLPGHNDSTSWFDVTDSTAGVAKGPRDPYGHGTHVAGIILGGSPREPLGVAPGAHWIGVNIFDDGTTWDSHITQAFQWLLAPDGDPANAPQIINCSWASRPEYVSDYLQWEILHNLEQAGIFVVFAAGNNGFEGPGSPASYPHAFSAGALKKEGDAVMIAPFSSRGPVKWHGMNYTKPEITAPGTNIRSAWLNGGYAILDGTSTAAAHVSGSAALMLQAYPDMSPAEIGYSFKQSARWFSAWNALGAKPNGTYGYGLLDAAAALRIKELAAPELLFYDGADDGIVNWGTSPLNPWKITEEKVNEGEFAFADSPGDRYPNNTSSWLALNEPISVSGYHGLVLSFQHYYDLPRGENRADDHATVEFSTDGRNWVRLYRFAGSSEGYIKSILPLKLPAEAERIFLRFRLQSNGNGPGVGWYIDEIMITARPLPLDELDELILISEMSKIGTGADIKVRAEALFGTIHSRLLDPYLLLWHSSNPAVARVENGTVLALTAGVTEISGQFAGRTAQFRLEVIEVPAPVAVPAPGTFINETSVRLEEGLPGSKIYYTLDGSKPDQQSNLYEKPLSITETTVLKARTYLEGIPGATVTLAYTIVEGSTLSGSLQLQHRPFITEGIELYIICRTTGKRYNVALMDKEGLFSVELPLGRYQLVAKKSRYLAFVESFELSEKGHFTLPPALLYIGDINMDNRIDLIDLALISLAYGTAPGDEHWDPRADVNSDYRVDIADLNILSENYGKSTPNVP